MRPLSRLHELNFFRLLAAPDFRRLWLGGSVSILGDQIYLVALPWLVLHLDGSGLVLGSVLTAAALPRAAFILVGGALADRHSPKRLMLVSNVGRAALVALVAAGLLTGVLRLWHLYILSALFGLVDAIFYPAFTALVPRTLAAPQLVAGNALLMGTAQGGNMVGPAVAGLIISSAGLGASMSIAAVSFAFAALALSLMKLSGQEGPSRAESDGATAPGGPRELMSGIWRAMRYAWDEPVIRALLFVIAVTNLAFTGPFILGTTMLAAGRFGGEAMAFGWMLSARGGGALAGTLAAGVFSPRRRRGVVLISIIMILVAGLASLALPLHLWAACLVIALMSSGSGFANVILVAWLQEVTDESMRGRVMSLIMFASLGLAPASYLLAGTLADMGLVFMFLAAGMVMLTGGVVSAASKALRTLN